MMKDDANPLGEVLSCFHGLVTLPDRLLCFRGLLTKQNSGTGKGLAPRPLHVAT